MKRLKDDKAALLQKLHHEQKQHTAHKAALNSEIKDIQVGLGFCAFSIEIVFERANTCKLQAKADRELELQQELAAAQKQKLFKKSQEQLATHRALYRRQHRQLVDQQRELVRAPKQQHRT